MYAPGITNAEPLEGLSTTLKITQGPNAIKRKSMASRDDAHRATNAFLAPPTHIGQITREGV